MFIRSADGNWEGSHQIKLPKQAEFEDYSALAYHNGQIAVASQSSARLWVAQIDDVKKNDRSRIGQALSISLKKLWKY